MAEILDKKENNRLYELGYFGNKPRTWKSLNSWFNDCYTHNILLNEVYYALRTISVPGIQLPWYCQPLLVIDIQGIKNIWIRHYNIKEEDIVVAEYIPDEYVFIQMEIMRSITYLSLRYSKVKKMFRLALQEQSIVEEGMRAVMTLGRYMCPAAYTRLTELINEFPDSVIEVSVFNRAVGDLGWNTIIWEVRNY